MSKLVIHEGPDAYTTKDGKIIFGPVTKDEARDLARSVIEGNQQSMTDPRMLGTLATAVLVFTEKSPPEAAVAEQPKPDAPKSAQEAVA